MTEDKDWSGSPSSYGHLGYWCVNLWLHTFSLGMHVAVEASDKPVGAGAQLDGLAQKTTPRMNPKVNWGLADFDVAV